MANTETEDLTHYCRVCVQHPEQTTGQLDLTTICDEDENLTYSECFTRCTGINLDGCHSNEPSSLCTNCGLELQIAYNFYKKVEKSKKLLQYLMHENDEIPNDNKQMEKPVIKTPSGHIVECNDINITESIKISSMVSPNLDTNNIEIVTIEDWNVDEELISFEGQLDCDIHTDDTFEAIEELDADEDCVDMETIDSAPNEEVQDISVIYLVDKSIANVQDISAPANVAEPSSEKTTNFRVPTEPRQPSGNYRCSYCEKMFTLYSRMRAHRRIHEKNRPKYDCNVCGRVYTSKQARRVHQLQTHAETDIDNANSNTFSSACSVCGKKFAIAKLLEIHMRYHTGNFPFGCDLCDKKFAQRSHLETHKSVKHNSSRFICSFPNCGRLFTSSSSLRNHEYTHSGMPFECSYCQHGYPAKAKLKVHIRLKHGLDLSLEQLEQMRKFHITRSKPYLVKLAPAEE